MNNILADLARAKAIFQARAIATILDAPPPVITEKPELNNRENER